MKEEGKKDTRMNEERNAKTQKETMMKQSCNICKKKFRNVLLHIDKKASCKSKISEEDYNKLIDNSEEVKRNKNRKSKDRSRAKARESNLEKIKEDQRRWKRLSREKKKEESDHQEMVKIPDRCPSCKIKKKNILLHIQASESCFQKVDKKTYKEWTDLSKKRSKSIFQYKYVDKGEHTKAQNKYLEKKRKHQTDNETKEILKRDSRRNQQEKRRKFVHMSETCLLNLTKGRTPPEWMFRCYKLILEEEVRYKGEVVMTDGESNAWLKEFGTAFLDAAISMRILVKIPKSKWLSAIESLEKQQENEELRDKLFNLIGKLQAGENEGTKGIDIDKRYHSEKKISSQRWLRNENLITNEDEKILVEFTANIVGDKDGLHDKKLQGLLGITEDIENLCNAFSYTTNKTYQ